MKEIEEKENNPLAQRPRSENLCNEVDVVILGVNPWAVKLDYVLVLESLQQMDLRIQALQVLRIP